VDSVGSGLGPVAGSYEYGAERSGFAATELLSQNTPVFPAT
jgi:hypothetical protein